jgi:hypothetical protein
MEPKCQICNYPGVEMNCVCPKCQWENDDCLQIDDDNYFTVGFTLKPEMDSWYSATNRCSPHGFKNKIANK